MSSTKVVFCTTKVTKATCLMCWGFAVGGRDARRRGTGISQLTLKAEHT